MGNSSDGEEDTNNAREVIKKGNCQQSSSQSFPDSVQERRSQQPKFRNKVPLIHRTTSAPVSSTTNKKPEISRKSSLLRRDISTPEINTPSSQIATPSQSQLAKTTPQLARSASTPNIGTIVMKNSTGIDSMLGRKRKRKDASIKLVPENDRVFAGKTFYYVPPDDKADLRRIRITRARNFGAVWTTEVRIYSKQPQRSTTLYFLMRYQAPRDGVGLSFEATCSYRHSGPRISRMSSLTKHSPTRMS